MEAFSYNYKFMICCCKADGLSPIKFVEKYFIGQLCLSLIAAFYALFNCYELKIIIKRKTTGVYDYSTEVNPKILEICMAIFFFIFAYCCYVIKKGAQETETQLSATYINVMHWATIIINVVKVLFSFYFLYLDIQFLRALFTLNKARPSFAQSGLGKASFAILFIAIPWILISIFAFGGQLMLFASITKAKEELIEQETNEKNLKQPIMG